MIYLINKDRIFKLVKDFNELESDIKECIVAIESCGDEKLRKLLYHSIRAYFLDFHILCEDYISINLKINNKFKIDISAVEGMQIIKDINVIKDEFYKFYESSRRLRNRLAHRYKMPTDEELFNNLKLALTYINEIKQSIKNHI